MVRFRFLVELLHVLRITIAYGKMENKKSGGDFVEGVKCFFERCYFLKCAILQPYFADLSYCEMHNETIILT